MLRRILLPTVFVFAFVLTGALSCTNTKLEFPEPEQDFVELDDEVTISGQYCTSPASDIAFPVKIMFIIDGSGSQQFADQNRMRVRAVERAINALAGSRNTFFKIIVFNASIEATPAASMGQVYTNNNLDLQQAVANVAEADSVTDYQGALGTAYAEMLRDMVDIAAQDGGRAQLARTKYVTIFISDGLPDPQCQAGIGNDIDPSFMQPGNVDLLCEDQGFLNCLLKDPMNTTCSAGVCTYTDPFTGLDQLCFDPGDASSLFGGFANTELVAGNDYNQPYQILDKVQDLMDLQDRFEVAEMRFHTGLVLDPTSTTILGMFGDPTQAAPLLEQMADVGNGVFRRFNAGEGIDFLSFNFDSVKQGRVIRAFFADNEIATMGPFELELDSDSDGLTDSEEFILGTLAFDEDTDDDGYSDLFEARRETVSFDPLDPCLPPVVLRAGALATDTCGPPVPLGTLRDTVNCDYVINFDVRLNRQVKDFLDRDLDGLNDCEEIMAGTDRTSFDSDNDGIPDRLELQYGLDPLRWDADRDDDQDTIPNGLELEWHLNPTVIQTELTTRQRYRYVRPEVDVTIDGRPCYDFEARRVKLLSPGPAEQFENLGPGRNEIRLYIEENLADDLSGEPLYRVACVRPQYVPPTFKSPVCGRIFLQESDFRYIPNGDPIFNDPTLPIYDPDQCIEDFPDPFNCDATTGECSCAAVPELGCLDPLEVGAEDRDSCCMLCF